MRQNNRFNLQEINEWLDQNLASIAKEVINEALDKLSKNARN